MGFPGDAVVKNLPADAGGTGETVSIPGEGNGHPLQYSCLGNPMDRSLVGYKSIGHNESDRTE